MVSITYTTTLDGLTADHLRSGFFDGWPNPPTPETHLRLLQGSSHIVLAWDQGRVIGFITAISDKILSAYIPLLEVLPDYQGQGIGTELTRRMLEQLQSFYMIDLLCDVRLQPFYARLGMQPVPGMVIRNYEHQSGKA